MIVHSGIVDGMSMRINDSGVGGPSIPMLAGPVEGSVDESGAASTTRGGAMVDVVVGTRSVVVGAVVVDTSPMSLAAVTPGDVGVALDVVLCGPHPTSSVSAVMRMTVIDVRRARVR
jgi:hypothetical protein